MAQATGSILVSSIFASCFIPFIWQYAPTHKYTDQHKNNTKRVYMLIRTAQTNNS
jgi:hypothetical protein